VGEQAMSDTDPTKLAMDLTDPGKIADAAESIYEAQYQKEFEETRLGHFVVIEVQSRAAYSGEFAEDALKAAREGSPNGVFHLIRVGSPGAFRVSYIGKRAASWNWTLRPTG
jgi:hypothetical protein